MSTLRRDRTASASSSPGPTATATAAATRRSSTPARHEAAGPPHDPLSAVVTDELGRCEVCPTLAGADELLAELQHQATEVIEAPTPQAIRRLRVILDRVGRGARGVPARGGAHDLRRPRVPPRAGRVPRRGVPLPRRRPAARGGRRRDVRRARLARARDAGALPRAARKRGRRMPRDRRVIEVPGYDLPGHLAPHALRARSRLPVREPDGAGTMTTGHRDATLDGRRVRWRTRRSTFPVS